MSDRVERSIKAIEQFAEARSRLTDNKIKLENDMRDKDMALIKSYHIKVKKLLADISTYNSYRELSITKTKLEEAEMWLSKLLKERGEK